MNIEELRDFCLSLKGTEENMPWTEPQYSMLATFSIGGKWYCLLDMDKKYINLKCRPEKIPELQEKYKGAVPAWHMNKQHWLGITLESDVPDSLIKELLSEGYSLVMSHLPKSIQSEIKNS